LELSNDQIRKILPHRYPLLLVDRILDYEPGKWAKGIKCVTANEMNFLGHFPEKSIMPGVLIIEALAQTGAIAVLTVPENQGKIILFGGIKNARFKTPVTPGDVMLLDTKITRMRGPIGIGEAVATVGDNTVCVAMFSFSITNGQ
jgi:3-hydroxyacyl-[acyl-carrier-protein] dehydratase